MKRVMLLFLCIFCTISLSTITLTFAGEKSSGKKKAPAESIVQDEAVKTAPAVLNDAQPSSDRIMTVMIVVLISWIGIALYLFRIDRKVSALEKKLDE